MVAIIDYDAGNIKSVEKALRLLGADVVVTRDEEVLLSADHVVLPGVGAFADAMNKLVRFNLVSVIEKIIDNKTPFLGICLGLQLLFESSEEGVGVPGLGILKGKIVRIPQIEDLKVPHMGWNLLDINPKSRLLKGIDREPYTYFVHSYYLQAEDEDIVSSTVEYGVRIHASIESENIFACQFHPEKSSAVGLKILENFLHIRKEI